VLVWFPGKSLYRLFRLNLCGTRRQAWASVCDMPQRASFNPTSEVRMKSRRSHIFWCIVACTGVVLAGALLPLAFAQDAAGYPYGNPRLSAEQRAADLVHRMTLAEKASEMQNNSAAVPRLNIPAYQWWSEALHGVINEGVTEYPEPIGLAATFDSPGIHTMAGQIGIEGRIKNVQNAREGHIGIMGGLDFCSPNLNIFRDPRWCRPHSRGHRYR
jgi:beta-glucosidase